MISNATSTRSHGRTPTAFGWICGRGWRRKHGRPRHGCAECGSGGRSPRRARLPRLSPPSAGAAILGHTRAAVTPPTNAILHERVVGVQNGTPVAAEYWQETGPPYASLGFKGPANGPRSESADDGTTSYQYDGSSNTIYERPDTSAPTSDDPVSLIKRELSEGHAQYEGEATLAGRRVYAIRLSSGLVAYVDETTCRPLALDDPQDDGSVLRLDVVVFEYLQRTPANLRLLSMTARHPDARVDTNPSDAPSK